MRRLLLPVLLASGCVVAACGSAPAAPTAVMAPSYDPDKDPYWMDPNWQTALLNAVQSVVRSPKDMDDLSAPYLHVTVQFSYHDGDIEDPQIVESTGHPDLDQLILQQVVTAVVPKPTGFDAAEPHPFALELDVPTPLEAFKYTVYAAVDRWKVYPKEAIMAGATGNTVVDFDYLDGMIHNITVAKSSRVKVLDGSSINAVSRSTPPVVPIEYTHKTLHMELTVCYSLIESSTDIKNPCPTGGDVIQVTGTRIRRTEIRRGGVN